MSTGTDVLNGGEQQQQAQGATGGEQKQEPAWYANLPAERHAYIQNKGWSDPAAMLESYTNLEKVVGVPDNIRADQLLIAPKSDAKPEEIAAFLDKANKIGVPSAPADYGFKAPAGVDQAQVDAGAQWLHAAGVPKPMAEKVIAEVFKHETAQAQAFEAQSVKDLTDLQAELGDKFDDSMELGRRAFKHAEKEAGLNADFLNKLETAVGTKTMLKLFAVFGKNLTEATAPNGGQQSGDQFRMSKDAAQAKITDLYKDAAFMARYSSPNPMERQRAIDEMEQYQKIVAGTA